MSEQDTGQDTRPPLALPPGVDRLSDLGTLLSLRETAARLGLSAKTVRRMVDRGELPGAHQVPMPSGKGVQWVVPYSSVVAHENANKKQTALDPVQSELAQLREKVTRLETDLALQRALADERSHQLEQLHLTWRTALGTGQDTRKQRRWGRKQPKG